MAEGDSIGKDYNTDEDPIYSFLRVFGIGAGVEECQEQHREHKTATEGDPVVVQHNEDSCSETVNFETSSREPCATPMSSTAPITEMPGDSQGGTSSASPLTITWTRKDNGLLVCNLCSYSTKRLCHQVYHSRTQTGERPFSCDKCPQSFKQSGTLVIHRRTHTGERPYVCTICQAAFKDSSHLHRHMTIHSEERP